MDIKGGNLNLLGCIMVSKRQWLLVLKKRKLEMNNEIKKEIPLKQLIDLVPKLNGRITVFLSENKWVLYNDKTNEEQIAKILDKRNRKNDEWKSPLQESR